ncbi:hypothetical protein ACFFOS_27975, partial [Nocardioides kongjuensis]
DLMDLANLFIRYVEDGMGEVISGPTAYADTQIAKLVPADMFGKDDRWDVTRHWTDEEQVALGQRAEAVERGAFVDQVSQTFRELLTDLDSARAELDALEDGPMGTFALSDSSRFTVRSGVRIRNVDLRDHPGEVPVYSVFTRANVIKGRIDADWLREAKGVEPEEFPSVTVMATGASAVGLVHLREAGSVMTDDVVIVQPWPTEEPGVIDVDGSDTGDNRLSSLGDDGLPAHDIDLGYLAVALARTIAQGGYMYEAKLYVRRVTQLVIEVPVREDGRPDTERQVAIARVVKRIDEIRDRIDEANRWIRSSRLA